MKQGIHPQYVECTVTCSCGNTFKTHATVSEMKVELCNECHPFYTGQQKFVDTGGRVQRFADKFGGAAAAQLKKAEEAKAAKAAKGDKKFLHEVDVFKALAAHLDSGKSARTFECSDEDKALIATSDLLTLKPIIYAANMDEDGFANQANNAYLKKVTELAKAEGSEVLPICAKLEQDIAELEGEEKQMFLDELGIAESGLDRLIKCSYSLLGLISFLTYGKDECRAWTIKKGTKAPQAAGKIHSDIERGFIRAEVIAFDDMMKYGSVSAAKEKGQLRSEGKEYVVQDGDMIYFRFNV